MNAMQSIALRCAVVLAALVPVLARADGGFFPRWGYSLTEYEQLAFLEWDEGAGAETLVIMPGFQGDAREFAWVVPVPAAPQVAVSHRALFDNLIAFTAPEYRRRESSWDCEDEYTYDAGDAESPGVDVIRHEVIGAYDVMVVQADDGAALTDSLTAWGFLHVGNAEQAEVLLADYVARGWSFVTMTVDSAAFAQTYPPDYYGYHVHGGLQPIQLTFAASAPVYPMRLSSLSASWTTRVVVFACAEHRLEFAGATVTYANRFGEDELAAVNRSWPTAAARLRPGRFLTRLERTMDPTTMSADLVLTRAPDDDEFQQIRYSEFPTFGVFLAGSILIWVFWKARCLSTRRRPVADRVTPREIAPASDRAGQGAGCAPATRCR